MTIRAVRAAEQIVLPLGSAPLCARRTRQRCVNNLVQTRAPGKQVQRVVFYGVEGAGANQTFKYSPVYCGRIHSLREVIKRAERTHCASPDNCFHTCVADSLNRSQSIPDGAYRRGEARFAFIDVRRQQLDTLCPKLLGILKYLAGVLQLIGEDRGVEVFRIMRLQISSLESEVCIGNTVAARESVVREFSH